MSARVVLPVYLRVGDGAGEQEIEVGVIEGFSAREAQAALPRLLRELADGFDHALDEPPTAGARPRCSGARAG